MNSDELREHREALLREAGWRQVDLRKRWTCLFGRTIAASTVHDIVTGTIRSAEKELDIAELLEVDHSEIYPPIDYTPRSNTGTRKVPTIEELYG